MEINITELSNGMYGLFNDTLTFEVGGTDKIKLKLNRKSALEIMATLIDSVNLLDDEAENLIYKVEDKINGD